MRSPKLQRQIVIMRLRILLHRLGVISMSDTFQDWDRYMGLVVVDLNEF